MRLMKIRGLLRSLGRAALLLFLAGFLAAAGAAIWAWPKYKAYEAEADSYDLTQIGRIPAISEVFDAKGHRYSRLQGEVRYVIPLDKVPKSFIDALIAREDNRFHEHRGLDYRGILRASLRNLRAGRAVEGASTLTQQLARNSFDLSENKWERKCVEALLALRIEKKLTKDQILEAYINRIYYGTGYYGLETAARACFGKSASEMTLSESAILAGLIRSPNRFTPLERAETSLEQRDQVLERMESLGLITSAEAKAAREEKVPLAKRRPPVEQQDYAMDTVWRDLRLILPQDEIDQGGLKIYTTIDNRLQLLAADAVEHHLAGLEAEKDWPHPKLIDDPENPGLPCVEGALVCIDNQTGGIRAVVGGRNFKRTPYNRAILAKRQIGSTFKPFVYAAAFSRGLLPGTLIDDGPIGPGDIISVKTTWSPKNSDNRSAGLLPAGAGLIQSRNTMTVRAGEFATLNAVRAMARNAGFGEIPALPAIYLGAFEVNLATLTGAYTVFPNDGVRKQTYIIERIENRNGKVIYQAPHVEIRVLKSPVNHLVDDLLASVVKKGTAASAASLGLTLPAAGKTGTTDEYKDAWFLGYTSRLTTGVWVGLDQPREIVKRGYGSRLALPIWVEFMQQAAQVEYTAAPRKEPANLQSATLCRASGLLATMACEGAHTVYSAELPAGIMPSRSCPLLHDGVQERLALAEMLAEPALPATVTDPADIPLVNGADPASAATPAPSPAGERYRIQRTDKGFIFH